MRLGGNKKYAFFHPVNRKYMLKKNNDFSVNLPY